MNPILGIHDGHNAAAIVLDQGRVVAGVQEERLTRVKNQGGLPRQAIAEVLSMRGITSSDLSDVALNALYVTYDHWDRDPLCETYEKSSGLSTRLKQPLKGTFVDDLYQKNKAQQRSRQFAGVGIRSGLLMPVIHHTAHAAAAYYGSGWKGKVLVLTCDGAGDRLSASVSLAEKGSIQQIASIPENDSIGHLYSMVTYCMGMVPLEHEYKVMGLAPYVGDAAKAQQQAKLFADLFEFNPKNSMLWRRRRGVPSMHSAYSFVQKLLYRQLIDFR